MFKFFKTELGKEFLSQVIWLLVWLMVIVLLRWKLVGLPSLAIGSLLGVSLIDLDHLIYIFFIAPEEDNSVRVRALFKGGASGEAVRLMAETHYGRTKLSLHNAGAILILGIMSFWILSSSVSWIGKGMVTGMFLHLLKDHLEGLLEGREENVRETLFWPLRDGVPVAGARAFVIVMLLVFLGLSWMVVRG